jgi:adenylosuccinate lyase
MQISTLTAISPIDGRYYNGIAELSDYFSEFALIRTRTLVEIEYFIALCELPLPPLSNVKRDLFCLLRRIYQDFSIKDAMRIKEIERTTNHDVKAVEYFLKEQFDSLSLSDYKEFIHFGLTSQDINNTASPYLLQLFYEKVYLPNLQTIRNKLWQMAHDWQTVPMLAHTHGQPASPTRLGKEILVFVNRLEAQIQLLKQIPFCGKFGGATGNFNAHLAAYPEVDWTAFGDRFLKEKLSLFRLSITTQIEHYAHLAAFFDALKRINNIIIDLDRDIWTYISMEYFKQASQAGEVGSSTMPHKINPIDFENSEGNMVIANALLEAMSAKLPISRLQRDLTDSTVTRNTGVPAAHTIIAFHSLRKGLDKLILNESKINSDLQNNWAVVSEGIQTILRREGYPNPYEALKTLTRGKERITQESISQFIDTLTVSDAVKAELKKITPYNYTGISPDYTNW